MPLCCLLHRVTFRAAPSLLCILHLYSAATIKWRFQIVVRCLCSAFSSQSVLCWRSQYNVNRIFLFNFCFYYCQEGNVELSASNRLTHNVSHSCLDKSSPGILNHGKQATCIRWIKHRCSTSSPGTNWLIQYCVHRISPWRRVSA